MIFLNDTSSYSSHFGCQLVCQTVREQFARTGLEMVGSYGKNVTLEDLAAIRRSFDFIVINGEGSIHHGRNMHLVALAEEFPAALINCVYEENPPHDALSKFLLISARESNSAEAIQAAGAECEVVPDLVFGSILMRAYAQKYRRDRERGVVRDLKPIGLTDNVVGPRLFSLRMPTLRRHPSIRRPTLYLDYLSGFERLCVGRFHAACAAAMMGIPFTSWDSNTWKTQAMMADMGAANQHFSAEREALAAAPSATIPASMTDWVRAAPARIEALFDQIAGLARAHS